jgi:hypothetical protein
MGNTFAMQQNDCRMKRCFYIAAQWHPIIFAALGRGEVVAPRVRQCLAVYSFAAIAVRAKGRHAVAHKDRDCCLG